MQFEAGREGRVPLASPCSSHTSVPQVGKQQWRTLYPQVAAHRGDVSALLELGAGSHCTHHSKKVSLEEPEL